MITISFEIYDSLHDSPVLGFQAETVDTNLHDHKIRDCLHQIEPVLTSADSLTRSAARDISQSSSLGKGRR